MPSFFPAERPQPRLATDCVWLRRTIDSGGLTDPFRVICTHIVRDGKDCIGPFLEDVETACRLWEPNEQPAARRRPRGSD